ncbi:MAG: SGNH/GDSL hydrolase family protein [Edaphobacter sp.]|uniref:SGNH/GDSL hydrolase family protein n=1 Tax=Edaphobacter sp. TaxID=1934404 RepID=UPI00238E475D|nr:SGNH/GDSL hydrolase family protein [Edaphobacter sp.]MDE1176785.1 SGNH/GDSL hydrolase family protein [Edaphobacter sp.]
MNQRVSSPALFLACLLVLTFAGCADNSSSTSSSGSSNTLAATQAKNAGNFSNTIFLGDSLTAGYQNGSLLDTQQVNGWSALVAKQAQFKIVLPLIAAPGAPGVLKLVSVGPPPVLATTSGTTTGRDDVTAQPTDLAVPGALVNDAANTVPLANPTTAQQLMNQLVLGFPGLASGQALSQTGQAIKAQPTTIFLWIGNNDALAAALAGTPAAMTSTANFTAQYTALIQQLSTQAPAHLVIANIPDVTLVPYLQPAAGVLAQFAVVTQLPASTLGAMFGISTGDYVTPEGLTEIAAILAGTQKTVLSDAGVLTSAEAATAKQQVTAYNQVIAAQVTAANATLVDINALFTQIATNGVAVNGVTGTNAFLGGLFSLDGIHPTNTGYAVVANTFIDTMNAKFNTKIADVDLTQIAAADPLWPTNLGKDATAKFAAPGIPAALLQRANAVLLPEGASQ